jgi:hypothetical protein
MELVWKHFRRGGSEQLCMLALADWADDGGGSIRPSMLTLAQKIGLKSRSQARRLVHGFVAEGLVEVVGNATGGRPGATRHYRIHLARLIASSGQTGSTHATGSAHATGSTHATGSGGATGSAHAQDGSHGCEGTGSTHATLTVIEPSVNRQGGRARCAPPRAPGVLPANFPEPEVIESVALQVPRLSADRLQTSIERFVLHHRSKGSKMADWPARLRLWVQEDEQRHGASGGIQALQRELQAAEDAEAARSMASRTAPLPAAAR